MNEGNLIPMNKRTESEQREITRKGGQKSGEARRKKKQIKQLITELLQSKPDMSETIGDLDEDENRISLLVRKVYFKALSGDIKAFETLMKYAGEDPDQKRKDAELKLKREAMKLQTEQFKINNEIEEPVKIIMDI